MPVQDLPQEDYLPGHTPQSDKGPVTGAHTDSPEELAKEQAQIKDDEKGE